MSRVRTLITEIRRGYSLIADGYNWLNAALEELAFAAWEFAQPDFTGENQNIVLADWAALPPILGAVEAALQAPTDQRPLLFRLRSGSVTLPSLPVAERKRAVIAIVAYGLGAILDGRNLVSTSIGELKLTGNWADLKVGDLADHPDLPLADIQAADALWTVIDGALTAEQKGVLVRIRHAYSFLR